MLTSLIESIRLLLKTLMKSVRLLLRRPSLMKSVRLLLKLWSIMRSQNRSLRMTCWTHHSLPFSVVARSTLLPSLLTRNWIRTKTWHRHLLLLTDIGRIRSDTVLSKKLINDSLLLLDHPPHLCRLFRDQDRTWI